MVLSSAQLAKSTSSMTRNKSRIKGLNKIGLSVDPSGIPERIFLQELFELSILVLRLRLVR